MGRFRIEGYIYLGEFDIRKVGDKYEGEGAIQELRGHLEKFLFYPRGEYEDSVIILDEDVSETASRIGGIGRDNKRIYDIALKQMFGSAIGSRRIIPRVEVPVLDYRTLERVGAVWPSDL